MLKILLTMALIIMPLQACSKTILRDDGGYVLDYWIDVSRTPATEQVRIMGWCASACTLYLSHPNVCVGKNVKLGFHSSIPPEGLSAAKQKSTRQYFNELLMREYPEWVRDFINKNGGLTKKLIIMEYADLRGKVPDCG